MSLSVASVPLWFRFLGTGPSTPSFPLLNIFPDAIVCPKKMIKVKADLKMPTKLRFPEGLSGLPTSTGLYLNLKAQEPFGAPKGRMEVCQEHF
jgi:hypothetical protein